MAVSSAKWCDVLRTHAKADEGAVGGVQRLSAKEESGPHCDTQVDRVGLGRQEKASTTFGDSVVESSDVSRGSDRLEGEREGRKERRLGVEAGTVEGKEGRVREGVGETEANMAHRGTGGKKVTVCAC